jgi:hypothetical protein
MANYGAATAGERSRAQQSAAQRRKSIYVRCIWVLGRLDGDGRAAHRAMALVGPDRVARARAPGALDAAIPVDGRLVARHGRGGVGGRCETRRAWRWWAWAWTWTWARARAWVWVCGGGRGQYT